MEVVRLGDALYSHDGLHLPDHHMYRVQEPVYRSVMDRRHVGIGSLLDTLVVSASES